MATVPYAQVSVERLEVSAYTVPTDFPESDGTAEWGATTMIRPGVASMAIAAVDTALWDLKARLLELPLATVLDAAHETVPVYGSGGFTSYPNDRLAEQLSGWAEQGIPRVKMKMGRRPDLDVERVRVAREAIGPDTELYVDANGAYGRVRALWFARRFAEDHGVTWFEEPLFDGVLEPVDGRLRPDLTRPGNGLEFKRADAAQFAVR